MVELAELVNKAVPLKWNGAELSLELSHALFSSYDIDQGTKLLLKTVANDPALASARRILDEGCGNGVIGLALAKAFPQAELCLRDRDLLALAFAERNRLRNKLRGVEPWTDPEGLASRTARPAPRIEAGLLAGGQARTQLADRSETTIAAPDSRPFDFVISNLPAKAGPPVLEAFFRQAASGLCGLPPLLGAGARLAIVVVNPLAEKAASWLAASELAILYSARGPNHQVFVASRRDEKQALAEAARVGQGRSADAAQTMPQPRQGAESSLFVDLEGIDLSAYQRGEAAFTLGDIDYRARGFWGLPGFDTVGYETQVAAKLIARASAGSLVRDALLINPGVGHMALWIARTFGVSRLFGAGRDLLSLAATGANLALLGSSGPAYRAMNILRIDEAPEHSMDLIVEFPEPIPEYDWIGPFWDRAGRLAKRGAVCVAAARPTEIIRLEKRRPSGWQLASEIKRKGYEGMAWRRV